MLELTKENFDTEVVSSDIAVLVDFWAPWCGPCKLQGPVLEEFAKEIKDNKLKIAKLNIDENQELAQKFNILSIPTIAIFEGGEIKDQFVGLQQKDSLLKKTEKYIIK